MASAVASNSKDVPLPLFLRKVLAEPTSGARHELSSSRGMPFGRDYDSSDSDDDDRLLCAHDFPGLILSTADLFDSFGSPMNLSGLLSKLKDVTETLPKAKTRRGSLTMPAPRGWWVAKQNKDALTLQVPMPGLGKEDVKVRAEKNTLVILGCKEAAEDGKGSVDAKETAKDGKGSVDAKETAKDGKVTAAHGDNDDVYEGGNITRRIDLPADAYKMDQVKAEMKNGLLKVTVPKVKEEERKDVFYVTVE